MKLHWLLLFSFFFFSVAWSQADSTKHRIDSLNKAARLQARWHRQQLRKDLRLSKADFLAKYGTDDTARALMHLFARKQMAGTIKLAVSPILGAVGMVSLVVVAFGGGPEYVVLTLLGAGLYNYGFYGGIVQIVRYPRIHLMEAIEAHWAGIPYPEKYIKHLSLRDFQKNAPK